MTIALLSSVSAMYSRKPVVVAGVAAAFCVEFGVNAWLLSHGIGAWFCLDEGLDAVDGCSYSCDA